MKSIRDFFVSNPKPKKLDVSDVELRMIKKFRNAVRNHMWVISSEHYKLNKEHYTMESGIDSVVNIYEGRRKELLRIISTWEKQIKERKE
jgi:hypothetical protein